VAFALPELRILDVPLTAQPAPALLRQWVHVFTNLIAYCEQLHTVRLNWVVFQTLTFRYGHFFGVFLSRLQKVVICDTFAPLKARDLPDPTEAVQQGLHTDFPNQFVTLVAGVRDLDVNLPTAFAPDMVRALGAERRQMESLRITGCQDVADEDMQRLLRNCPDLRNLVSINENLSAASWPRALKTLDLRGSWYIDDAAVVLLTETCSDLRELNLARAFLTDISIDSLALRCPRLETLDVRHSENLCPNKLRNLVEHCPRLRLLVVDNTCLTPEQAQNIVREREREERIQLVIELTDDARGVS
jgi:hypothetical protein